MLLNEDPTVTVKCRKTALKVLILYFDMYLHVSEKLNSLSCSFTSISFLSNKN